MPTISRLGAGIAENERQAIRVLESESLDFKKVLHVVSSINGGVEEGYPDQELIASLLYGLAISDAHQALFLELASYLYQNRGYNQANIDYGMVSALIRLTQVAHGKMLIAIEAAAVKWLRRILSTRTNYDSRDASPGEQLLGFVKVYFIPSRGQYIKRGKYIRQLLELVAKCKYKDDNDPVARRRSSTWRQEAIAEVIVQVRFELLDINSRAQRLL